MIAHNEDTKLLHLNLFRSIRGNRTIDERLLGAPLLSAIARHKNGSIASFTGSFELQGGSQHFRHTLFLFPDESTNIGAMLLPRTTKEHYSDPQIVCAFLSIVDYLIAARHIAGPIERYTDSLLERSTDPASRARRKERVEYFFAIRDESRAYLAALDAERETRRTEAEAVGRTAVAPYAKFRAALLGG